MSLLNCEIYQRGRLSRVADTELILLIAHLIVRQMGRRMKNSSMGPRLIQKAYCLWNDEYVAGNIDQGAATDKRHCAVRQFIS